MPSHKIEMTVSKIDNILWGTAKVNGRLIAAQAETLEQLKDKMISLVYQYHGLENIELVVVGLFNK